MQEGSKNARCMPYPFPPPPPGGPTITFSFNLGDPVNVKGMDMSGVITCLAVNNTGGRMYEVDNGNKSKLIAESFLTLNQYLYEPWCGTEPVPPGPIPLRKEEDEAVNDTGGRMYEVNEGGE
jgi:hypothetical protein